MEGELWDIDYKLTKSNNLFSNSSCGYQRYNSSYGYRRYKFYNINVGKSLLGTDLHHSSKDFTTDRENIGFNKTQNILPLIELKHKTKLVQKCFLQKVVVYREQTKYFSDQILKR